MDGAAADIAWRLPLDGDVYCWCFWACSAHLLSSEGIVRTTSALDMLRSEPPLPAPVVADWVSCSKDLRRACLVMLTGLQAHSVE